MDYRGGGDEAVSGVLMAEEFRTGQCRDVRCDCKDIESKGSYDPMHVGFWGHARREGESSAFMQ